MEKVIEEVPVALSPRQFWGAVKIYTEKPHVINRRICGTADVWVGFTDDNISRETLVQRLRDFLESNPKVGVNGDAACSGPEPGCEQPELHNDINSSALNCTENFGRQYTEAESMFNDIRKALCSEGFREFSLESFESKSSVHEEENEPHKLTESQSSSHPSHEKEWKVPWHYLMESKVAVISLIRKIIPKQLEKFIPTYEVVIMGELFLIGESYYFRNFIMI